MLPWLHPQRLLSSSMRTRKYIYHTCALTQSGSCHDQNTTAGNDLEVSQCSKPSPCSPKRVPFSNESHKMQSHFEDTTSNPGICSTCCENRKSAYQRLHKKHRLASLSTHIVDHNMFHESHLTNHDNETDKCSESILQNRHGNRNGTTIHRHAAMVCGALACSALRPKCSAGAQVRWSSSRAANVIPLEQSKPVQTGEIKKFLSDNEFAYREGYTCLISTCPRHVRRKIRLSELDRLYINRTTGRFTCVSHFAVRSV